MQSLLIILFDAIGDVTRALPLAVRIRRAYPTCRISWAVEPRSRGVLEDHSAVDRLVVFQRSEGFGGYRRFIAELRKERYEVVLDLQRHFKSGVTSRLSGGKRRIGFHPRSAKEFNWIFNNEYIEQTDKFSPKIYHYQRFGDRLQLPAMEPLDFGLALSPTLVESAARLIATNVPIVANRFCGLLIGSTWETRLWPVEHYVALADELYAQCGYTSLILGGPVEKECGDEIAAKTQHAFNLAGQTTLRELMAVLARTEICVGPDSGPMRIAAALGRPVVSLWGATSPRRSRPEGSEQLVMQSAIGCSPCYLRRCPGLGTLCMESISPRAVAAMVVSSLKAQ